VLKFIIISFALLLVLQVVRGIWKDVLQVQQRKRAIALAAGKLPRSEQVDWFNRTGRYKDVGAVPRTLAPKHMTSDEYHRYSSGIGEFAG
jgi:hypothetical protein